MRLIVVDGLDGVGKDTHAALIRERYEARGETVIVRSHPSVDNLYGRRAKQALLAEGRLNQVRAGVFYALDVLNSLRKYYRHPQADTLIMVRYLMGTAYLPHRLARLGYRFFEKLVPTSCYLFFLDASPQELVQRIKQRSETEMFETLEEFMKVRSKAIGLATGWFIINTSRPLEETAAEISRILDVLDKRSSAD